MKVSLYIFICQSSENLSVSLYAAMPSGSLIRTTNACTNVQQQELPWLYSLSLHLAGCRYVTAHYILLYTIKPILEQKAFGSSIDVQL